MPRLTEALVLRPTPEQTRWLGAAPPLHEARRDWVGTLLIPVCAFMCARFVHAGPITALMVAMVVLAASASAFAPRVRHALVAHTARQLRKRSLADAGLQAGAFRLAVSGYALACVGLGAILVGYNLIALSVLMVWGGTALELYLSAWPTIAVWSIALGWPALIIGERWLLRSLDR